MPLFKDNYKVQKTKKKITKEVILNLAEKTFISLLICTRNINDYIVNAKVLVSINIKANNTIFTKQSLNYIILP